MLEDKVDSPADRKSRTSSKVTVKYGILFLIVSGVFAYYGYLIGGWGWLLWWPALSFSTVACGYLGLGAKIFGKRTDGTIAWHVFPYLLRSRHLCIPAHRPQQKHPRVRATDRARILPNNPFAFPPSLAVRCRKVRLQGRRR